MITIAVASDGTSHENRQPVMMLMNSSIRQKQRKTMMQPNFGSQFRYHFQYLLILTWNTAANRSQTIGFAF